MQLATSLPENSQIQRTRRLPSASRQLVLLAPSASAAPSFFNRLQIDTDRHRNLLAEMQKMRGSVYLKAGVISPAQLTHDGRHQLDRDNGSWHLLVLNRERRVCGCQRYQEHPRNTDFSMLGISTSVLARSTEWGWKLASAVKAELALARRLDLPYVEIGGWALLEQVRGTTEALRMALTAYSLAQALGGAVGLAQALGVGTSTNGSASILRRIGGRPLEYRNSELPSYYDPQYRGHKEMLRFYSWAPNPRYASWIAEIKTEMASIPVIAGGVAEPAWDFMKARSTFNSDLYWSRPTYPMQHSHNLVGIHASAAGEL